MFDPAFINGLKQSFGILSDNLRETGKVAYLLKRGGHTDAWTVLRALDSAYQISYVKDTFRNTILFISFSTDENFPDDFAQSAHIAWGVPDLEGEINLYKFDASQKDLAAADGNSPLWRGAAFRVTNERYLIPG